MCELSIFHLALTPQNTLPTERLAEESSLLRLAREDMEACAMALQQERAGSGGTIRKVGGQRESGRKITELPGKEFLCTLFFIISFLCLSYTAKKLILYGISQREIFFYTPTSWTNCLRRTKCK